MLRESCTGVRAPSWRRWANSTSVGTAKCLAVRPACPQTSTATPARTASTASHSLRPRIRRTAATAASSVRSVHPHSPLAPLLSPARCWVSSRHKSAMRTLVLRHRQRYLSGVPPNHRRATNPQVGPSFTFSPVVTASGIRVKLGSGINALPLTSRSSPALTASGLQSWSASITSMPSTTGQRGKKASVVADVQARGCTVHFSTPQSSLSGAEAPLVRVLLAVAS